MRVFLTLYIVILSFVIVLFALNTADLEKQLAESQEDVAFVTAMLDSCLGGGE